MSDKEPRRRKKRKDLQKKDDMRSEDPSFLSQKSDSKDSDDAELEEEFAVPSHQPSQTAKVVFVLLFSGLVVSMSFVFLSLKGAEKGPIDVFDGLHAEEHEESHIEEDAHGHNAVDTAHDDFDILPDLGSLFKFEFKDDQSEEMSETSTTEQLSPSSSDDTFTTASYFDHDTNEDLSQIIQDISEESESQEEQVEEKEEVVVTEEATIDSPIEETFTEAFSTEFSNTINEDQDDDTNAKIIENAINDYLGDNNDDQDEITPLETSNIESITEESEDIFEAPKKDSFLEHSNTEPVKEQKPVPAEEPVKKQKPVPTEEPVKEQKPVPTEEPVKEQKPVPTEEPVVRTLPSEAFEDMNEEFSFYEHADITNREDYLNREELDDIDRVLKKDLDDEDDDIDDEDDDNDNIQDEFDFWQF